MAPNKTTPKELWERQCMSCLDTDYNLWNRKRASIEHFSRISQSCIFTVDVFKERYDFASDNFSDVFGFNPAWIKSIRRQGDLLEERIHPDDRNQILDYQIEHGNFIYSLPKNERNDYCQSFQYRMLNANLQYINVISRHQVLEKDKNGNAWIIMGSVDISPDQVPSETIKRTVINRKTGLIVVPSAISTEFKLSRREKEVLLLIYRGFFSKEIAAKLNISLYTVNNHRKNILSKLNVDNIIEAINIARNCGIIS